MKLWRTVAYLVILGLVVFEAASPFVAKSQLDGNASKAAFESVLEYERSANLKSARAAAESKLVQGGCSLIPDDPLTPNDEAFWIDPDGTVHIVAMKTAPSLVLKRISQTKKWYTITMEAQSKRSRL